MTRGRKAHADPPVNVMVSIPSSLNAKLELLLYDPLLQKPKYGGRSALIQRLIREWVEKQQSPLTREVEGAILNPSLSTQEPERGPASNPDSGSGS